MAHVCHACVFRCNLSERKRKIRGGYNSPAPVAAHMGLLMLEKPSIVIAVVTLKVL